MPKTYSKMIRASGCLGAVDGHGQERELQYQLALAVRNFLKEAGLPHHDPDTITSYAMKARVTTMPRTGDDIKQLVELELDARAS